MATSPVERDYPRRRTDLGLPHRRLSRGGGPTVGTAGLDFGNVAEICGQTLVEDGVVLDGSLVQFDQGNNESRTTRTGSTPHSPVGPRLATNAQFVEEPGRLCRLLGIGVSTGPDADRGLGFEQ